MMLPEFISVIAGSAVLVGLFASIAKKTKSISAVDREWHRVEAAA